MFTGDSFDVEDGFPKDPAQRKTEKDTRQAKIGAADAAKKRSGIIDLGKRLQGAKSGAWCFFEKSVKHHPRKLEETGGNHGELGAAPQPKTVGTPPSPILVPRGSLAVAMRR